MPVTFGSVGDIIATGLLIKDLIHALNNSRGSAAEYRELIRELTSLEEVLQSVDRLCNANGGNGMNLELAALRAIALRIADECRLSITTFQRRWSKYDPSLGAGTSSTLKSAFAKVRWQVGEREDVLKFRAEVSAHAASLNGAAWSDQLVCRRPTTSMHSC